MHFCGSVQIENVVFNLAIVKSVVHCCISCLTYFIFQICASLRDFTLALNQYAFQLVGLSMLFNLLVWHSSLSHWKFSILSSKLSFIDGSHAKDVGKYTDTYGGLAIDVGFPITNYPKLTWKYIGFSQNERIVFQPTILRGYDSFRDGIHGKNMGIHDGQDIRLAKSR